MSPSGTDTLKRYKALVVEHEWSSGDGKMERATDRVKLEVRDSDHRSWDLWLTADLCEGGTLPTVGSEGVVYYRAIARGHMNWFFRGERK